MPPTNRPSLWLPQFPRRKKNSHKYDFGHAVIFGASSMTGATRLAAEACARIGAGVTTVIAPEDTGQIYRRTLKPHVIVEDFKNPVAHLKDKRRNAVLIGPGAGDNYAALRKIIKAALATDKKIVLDADALNAIAKVPHPNPLPKGRGKNVVMTPHEGEFKRLFPALKGTRLERAKKAAKLSRAIIVLKGGETVIAGPDGRVVVNGNAPPSLATAGAGDVLAGLITGLLAQGMEPFSAACAAVWIHGEAASRFGPGLVAGDLPGLIPAILKDLA